MKSRLLRLVAALFVLAASANAQEAKESALKLLEQSFDYVIAVLPQVTTEQLGEAIAINSSFRFT